MNFIALQQFRPVERKAPDRCIWCGMMVSPNRAHIISRKLTPGARNAPTLRFNVCASCNSTCGRLEEWVLRLTPLSWLRLMLYIGVGGEANSRHVPSYFFSGLLQEWVVFHLDAKTRSHVVATQLIRPFDDNPTLLTQAPQDHHEALLAAMSAAVRDNKCVTDVRASLPEGFAPRLVLDQDTVVLIVRTQVEASKTCGRSLQLDVSKAAVRHSPLNNTGQERHHFRWSGVNWTRFCAKSALEALCLFEGGGRCLSPAFRVVRDFVLDGTLQHGKEIIFSEHGPIGQGDVPTIPIVDLTTEQNAPASIAAIVPSCEPGMHLIDIYEIRGWVLASIVFAGFPATVLVLGGPDEHLEDFYSLIYDEQEASFDFLRLAHDNRAPVIPLPVPGDCFKDLAETYGLKPADL